MKRMMGKAKDAATDAAGMMGKAKEVATGAAGTAARAAKRKKLAAEIVYSERQIRVRRARTPSPQLTSVVCALQLLQEKFGVSIWSN